MARLLSERGRFLSDARVPGRLFDFGSYPGAVPSDQPNHWVCGEVHLLEDPSLLASLDEYEGSEFERGRVSTAVAPNCWIYWYVGSDAGRLIPSGDWFQR